MFLKWLLPSLPWDPLSFGFATNQRKKPTRHYTKIPANPTFTSYIISSRRFRRQPFLSRWNAFSWAACVYSTKKIFYRNMYHQIKSKTNNDVIWLTACVQQEFISKPHWAFFRKKVSLTSARNLLPDHPEIKQVFKAFFKLWTPF